MTTDANRYCPGCDMVLPATLQYFYSSGKKRDGSPALRGVCKRCYNDHCLDARYPERTDAVMRRVVEQRAQKQPVLDARNRKREAFKRILEREGLA